MPALGRFLFAAPFAPVALAALAAATLVPAGDAQAQATPPASPRFTVDLEAGPAWQSRNIAESPNDGTATRFSIEELAGRGPFPAGRLTLGWNPSERHGLRILLAPLSIRETATLQEEIRFEGETFEAGRAVEATYTFNSWRATYRYRFHEGAHTRAWVGGTAKVRDAVIALDPRGTGGGPGEGPGGGDPPGPGGARYAEKTDLGFVPLLHLAGEWRPAAPWILAVEADGLAGGPGRAIDAALTVGRELGDGWSLHAGYRTVEGGADIEEVYSFAWLHYATVGVRWRR